MRIGLVGYGTGGQHLHAPFIEAAEGVELAGVVARSAARVAAVKQDLPGMPIYDSLTSMIKAGVDAVTITTPPETRRELVLEAIDAGLHVVADKPFAPDAAGGRELDAAAKARGVVLGVFHNRRYDTDIRTLHKVIQSARLGKLWRVHSRMDQDNPQTLEDDFFCAEAVIFNWMTGRGQPGLYSRFASGSSIENGRASSASCAC